MPYRPGIVYRGDGFLFDAIAGAGRALGDALQERSRRRREDEQRRSEQQQRDVDPAAEEAKKTKTARTFLSTWMPDQKDRFESMGLAELEGFGKAMAARIADDDRQLRQETLRLNNAAVRDASARRLREEAGTSGFLSDVATFQGLAGAEPPMVLEPGLRATLQRPSGVGLAALARNPGAPEAVRDLVLREALATRDGGSPDWKPELVDLGSGVKVVRTGPREAQVVERPPAAEKPTVKVTRKEGAAEVTRELTADEFAQYQAEQERLAKQPRVDELLKRRRALAAEIGAGNRHKGFESAWLPSWGDRQKELAEVEQELRDLGVPPDAPPVPAAGEVGKTNTINGVRITRTK